MGIWVLLDWFVKGLVVLIAVGLVALIAFALSSVI